MTVSVELGLIDKGLEKGVAEVAAAAGKMSEEFKTGARSVRQFEQIAVRAYQRSETAAQRLAVVQEALNKAVKSGRLTQEQAAQALEAEKQRLIANLDNVKAARQEEQKTAKVVQNIQERNQKRLLQQKAIVLEMRRGNISRAEALRLTQQITRETTKTAEKTSNWKLAITASATGYISVTAAILQANRAIQAGIELEKEKQRLSRGFTEATLDLALLDPGRADEARRLALTVAGSRGRVRSEEEAVIAADALQTLASAANSIDKGAKDLAAVADAALIGIDIPLGTQLSTQARVQGADPGAFIRQTQAIGLASEKTAQQIGKNVQSFALFPDKDFAFAVAGVLTNAFEDRSEPFVRQTGKALADTLRTSALGTDAQSTGLEIIRALKQRGVDTTAEFKALVGDRTETVLALQTLVEKLGQLESYTRLAEEARVDVGRIAKARADLDQVSARDRQQLQGDIALSERVTARLLDEDAVGRAVTTQQLATDLVLKGRETFLGGRTTDESGLTTLGALAALRARLSPGDDLDRIPVTGIGALLEALSALPRDLLSLTEALRGNTAATENAGGLPTPRRVIPPSTAALEAN